MSHSSFARVNQKLSHAKFLIHVLHSNAESLKAFEKASYLEAICFHLYCAYQFYLRELAETYHLSLSSQLNNEDNLIQIFKSKSKFPVEAQELRDIRDQPNSWLAQLCLSYQAIWEVAVKPNAKHLEEADDSLIQVVSLDPETKELSQQSVEHWFQELTALIARQRTTSAEF